MAALKSRHACRACRRLKRKCTKDMPSCSLCDRLGKLCEYPDATEPTTSLSLPRMSNQSFPKSFFLDPNFFTPLGSTDVLAPSVSFLSPQVKSEHLPPADYDSLCESYFSSIHIWLPIISRKRLDHNGLEDTDTCRDLLLLAMKLCTRIPNLAAPNQEPLYLLAKPLCSAAEDAGNISLRLVQSVVLLATYEYSHAIYPASYLTIGRAARLGSLLGWHSGGAQQLFKSADTWTQREEQRRTWWAIFILDRLININTMGLPFAVPEPRHSELLPINDEDWGNGKATPSQALYAESFSSVATLGFFARTCQAAHMLGKIIQHREATMKNSHPASDILQEARNLHRALSSLHLSLEGPINNNSRSSLNPSTLPALAICASAQNLLYTTYGCLDFPCFMSRKRSGLETEMQSFCMDGHKVVISTVSSLALVESDCPFMATCFYATAFATSWFIREDHEPEMQNALQSMIDGLNRLSTRWAISAEFIALLEQGGSLKLADVQLGSTPAVS